MKFEFYSFHTIKYSLHFSSTFQKCKNILLPSQLRSKSLLIIVLSHLCNQRVGLMISKVASKSYWWYCE